MRKLYRYKKLIIGIIVVVLVATVWHKYHNKSKTFQQDSILVEVTKVKRGNMNIEAQAVGNLVASKSIQITPEVAGQVAIIIAHDGNFISQGSPILKLDDRVNRAKAESAKANLVLSETNYNRMAVLVKKGVVTQQAVDQALADLKGKKSASQESTVLADKMILTAPFDGALGKVKVSPGEYVTVGQQIVSLTDTKNLRVECNVSEKYISQLKVGQQVTMTTSAYPGQLFYGKVAFVSPTINSGDHTVSIYADVPNQDGKLSPGLFVNVTLSLGINNNVLVVPTVSLVATIDGQQVYKVVDGKVVAVPVTLGQRNAEEVQIINGLQPDDVVVTSGQQKVKDGMPVKVQIPS